MSAPVKYDVDGRVMIDGQSVVVSHANGLAFTAAGRLAVNNIGIFDPSRGYEPPVAYTAGLDMLDASQTVEYLGQVYAPIIADLPFTTSGTFETSSFRLVQGVSGADLLAPGGALMVGYDNTSSGLSATTVQGAIDEIGSTTLKNSQASLDPGAGKIPVARASGAIDAAWVAETALPKVKPTLLLDFANSKTVDPRITFTRSTGATYYDGKTVAKSEENLLLRSQEFDNASWTKFNASVSANSTVAPDGTSTAETLTANATTNGHNASQATSLVSGSTYTLSVYAKRNTVDYVNLAIINSSNTAAFAAAAFNLNTGAVSATNANGTGFSVTEALISDAGNGWYRCSLTAVHGSFGLTPRAVVAVNNDGTVPNNESGGRVFAGAGTESVFIWGAQLEQRSTVTAYTPTTDQPITRYQPALLTAAANVPRLDHNPVTGESLGLLVEEQRSNNITYSEDFSNANWTKTRATIGSNVLVAPDGALTMDKLVDSTDNDTHIVSQAVTTTAIARTFSVFAKRGGRNWLTMAINDSGNVVRKTYFDLANGVVGTAGTGITASIVAVGNGVFRCIVTVATAYAGSNPHTIGTATGDGVDSYAGNGFDGVYIWGAQAE